MKLSICNFSFSSTSLLPMQVGWLQIDLNQHKWKNEEKKENKLQKKNCPFNSIQIHIWYFLISNWTSSWMPQINKTNWSERKNDFYVCMESFFSSEWNSAFTIYTVYVEALPSKLENVWCSETPDWKDNNTKDRRWVADRKMHSIFILY